MPYEGCGGNCLGNVPDCFNTCFGAQTTAAAMNSVTECDFSQATSSSCAPMRTLWANGAWPNTAPEQQAFQAYSADYAINYTTGRWSSTPGACMTLLLPLCQVHACHCCQLPLRQAHACYCCYFARCMHATCYCYCYSYCHARFHACYCFDLGSWTLDPACSRTDP